MADAMVHWQTQGPNPQKCRAVFAHLADSRELHLLCADGKHYTDQQISLHHNAMNLNPANDPVLIESLPKFLDDLNDDGEKDEASGANEGFVRHHIGRFFRRRT
jgi:hypothetical protein